MAMRRLPVTLAAAMLAALSAGGASAGPTVVVTRPAGDPDTGELTFFIGGVSETGRSLKSTSVEILADGSSMGPPAAQQTLSDWAAVSSEGSATWRPPLAVGLVYPWIEGIPPGLLDAIHGFFRRIPTRTTVYPTIYGRLRQGRARLTAGEIGRLDEVPYLEGRKPNAIDAIELDLADLAADPAPIKILLIVTDGRDYADPKAEGPGDFGRLGAEIRRAGATPFIVAIPPPEADAAAAATNLRDLHEAAGGFLRSLDQADDLDNTLESLGQSVADLMRARVVPPWTWRTFGGSRRLSARLVVSDGRQFNAELGSVTFAAGIRIWLALAAVLLAAGGAGALVVMRRRGAPAPAPGYATPDEVLAAAHGLIRRGISPERAAEELSRNFPDATLDLGEDEAELLADPRFPYFRTRPGKLRLNEIRNLLAKKSSAHPSFGDSLLGGLASAVDQGMPPERAAGMISARVAVDEWTRFAGLKLQELAVTLRMAAGAYPVLGSPRARGIAVSVQDQLRALGTTEAILVGWLVRSNGPGRRGETLRLEDGRTVLGSGGGSLVRMADPALAGEHAEITRQGDDFVITPLGGTVRVEGGEITGPQALTDGETIQIGATSLVFRSASAGNMAG